jgi:uncharacterized membrane protein YcjF (UPF0283 family)
LAIGAIALGPALFILTLVDVWHSRLRRPHTFVGIVLLVFGVVGILLCLLGILGFTLELQRAHWSRRTWVSLSAGIAFAVVLLACSALVSWYGWRLAPHASRR